jgi:hypothetical protein
MKLITFCVAITIVLCVNSMVFAIRVNDTPTVVISQVNSARINKSVKSSMPIKVIGTIELGVDATGGYFLINSNKNLRYILRYAYDVDEATQNRLAVLIDPPAKVSVSGVLKTYMDGTTAFDDTQDINIYKISK